MQKKYKFEYLVHGLGQINFLLHQLGIRLDETVNRANRCRSCAAVTVQRRLFLVLNILE